MGDHSRTILRAGTGGLVACWFLLGTLYLRARLVLGRWPEPSADDPKGFEFGLHYDIVGLALWTAMVLTVIGLIAGPVVVLLSSQRQARKSALVLFMIASGSLILNRYVPIVSWYLD